MASIALSHEGLPAEQPVTGREYLHHPLSQQSADQVDSRRSIMVAIDTQGGKLSKQSPLVLKG